VQVVINYMMINEIMIYIKCIVELKFDHIEEIAHIYFHEIKQKVNEQKQNFKSTLFSGMITR
jgi:hypothetical protein